MSAADRVKVLACIISAGNVNPSTRDSHNFYGRIMMIVGPPYSQQNLAIYNKRGESLKVEIEKGGNI